MIHIAVTTERGHYPLPTQAASGWAGHLGGWASLHHPGQLRGTCARGCK